MLLLETFREETVVRRGDTKKPVCSRTPGLVRSRPTGAAPLSAVQTPEGPPPGFKGSKPVDTMGDGAQRRVRRGIHI
jgi:hypothetical protein